MLGEWLSVGGFGLDKGCDGHEGVSVSASPAYMSN